MKEICLSYENGHTFTAYVVRYFCFRNNRYLIYTLQEKDDRDYMKLYVVKIMKELGVFVSQTIRRTDEWNLMKELVKRILIEIKKGNLTIIDDLNQEELDKIVIYENKSFTMARDLVSVLVTDVNVPLEMDSSIAENDNYYSASLSDEEEIEVLDILGSEVEISQKNEIEVLDL